MCFTASISLYTITSVTCCHMWSVCSPSNIFNHWLSSRTGPHPELTVAAAVLVLLVIVIISLIVLVVIWKQVLLQSVCIHSHIFILSFIPLLSHLFMLSENLQIRTIKPELADLCFSDLDCILEMTDISDLQSLSRALTSSNVLWMSIDRNVFKTFFKML